MEDRSLNSLLVCLRHFVRHRPHNGCLLLTEPLLILLMLSYLFVYPKGLSFGYLLASFRYQALAGRCSGISSSFWYQASACEFWHPLASLGYQIASFWVTVSEFWVSVRNIIGYHQLASFGYQLASFRVSACEFWVSVRNIIG